jgi:flavin reductase (DIM6/NTAB) family NADH-FMN oxidoreductase RutF
MMGADFRQAMRRFPTGVTIVTTVLDGKPKGFTANAVTSVSAEPPTILICVNRQSRTHPLINLLRLDQRELAERFATREGADPFETIAHSTSATGAPILAGVLAYLDCELSEEHSAGTHTIFIGAVLASGFTDGSPLGYFNASYRDFACSIP